VYLVLCQIVQVHGEKVVEYLLELVKSTRKAEWMQNKEVNSKKGEISLQC